MKSTPYRLGVAGLGTVGAGTIKLLQDQAREIAATAGREIVVTAVNARDKNKKRDCDISVCRWEDDPRAMVTASDIDCLVEMIGGEDGLARELAEGAIDSGKDFITANKAMLAHHGYDLAKRAENKGVSLGYEAAVAGGIPAIKSIREGFAANEISSVTGILNGTCNYILTDMRETGRSFEVVLKEAQEAGYAEADPSFDVDGIDAAHKLALLAGLAFRVKPDFKGLDIRGIRNVSAEDIDYAKELGYRIKLLGSAKRHDNQIIQIMEPCLVPANSPIGAVEGVYNAVATEGHACGHSLLVGRGAGAGPTASAVLSDIIDLARGAGRPMFGVPTSQLTEADWGNPADFESRFYIRLTVIDKPGVIADVSAILRDCEISIEAFLQRGRDPHQPVPVVIVTHEALRRNVRAAATKIAALAASTEEPHVIRIEDF